jgi:hypothetical protein
MKLGSMLIIIAMSQLFSIKADDWYTFCKYWGNRAGIGEFQDNDSAVTERCHAVSGDLVHGQILSAGMA